MTYFIALFAMYWWAVIGLSGFVYWWIRDHELEFNDLVFASLCVAWAGPVAWLWGYLIHGERFR